jgi:hypothetical protein
MELEDQDEKETQGYVWEKAFERSWEALKEDESGLYSTAAEKNKKYIHFTTN